MARRPRKNKFRKKFTKLMQKKLVLLFAGIVLAFALLVGRITYINAFNGDKYSKIVLDQQQYQSRTIPFKRGDIVDRNGTKLATSQRVYNVILDAKVMNSDEKYVAPTIQVLADCFGLDKSDVEDQVEENPNSRYLIMKKGVSYEKAQEFEKIDEDDENYPNVNGIWLEEDYVRTYPYNTLASDVIGFTVSGNVGSNGIEASYNSILNGTDGREYGYLSEDSSYEKTVKEAQNGDTVVSTIDLQVQSVVEKYITQFNEENRSGTTLGSKNTAVMVMNPQNGEILAEASYPNYDLNNPRDLTKLHTEEELAALSDEEKVKELNSLWNNFCISSGYEPGSTFKPFTISEGLDLGVLTGDESYVCNGVLHVGDHDIHCSNRDGHGTQSLKVALENSCNVALMQIGSAIGKEQFVRYQQLFGFGQSTGIDLPGEAAGLLYSLEDMDSSTLATNAFGQNFNVTMTQLAASFCSLINGGNYYEPHVVKQIQDENGNVTENKDPVLVRHTISKETSDIIKDYMLGVVEEGTAKTAAVEGYDVGGKTGTAEKLPRGNGKYLVSFIGYAPQENPQVMVYVVIDEPNVDNQANSKLATTMASQIMTEIFPYLGVEKSADAKAADAKSSDSSASSDSSGDTPDDMATESGDRE
ncbi:penicillin-binding protein 2 [Dorea formicigenerans]|uniref:Penicillin-binding protein 2 n=1 Tax=Dorea formicigenerans TaxID=39486 RepID=A0A3E4F731_9FIRM|nr:penicillin-binding protein 2 [Dorea formicigenerans]RGI84951.1 penicillin-binding protein 2 [Dorea formicigenerans]RGI88662.1 penicillin-binding protein 2 [Dorea formicigenerans]